MGSWSPNDSWPAMLDLASPGQVLGLVRLAYWEEDLGLNLEDVQLVHQVLLMMLLKNG